MTSKLYVRPGKTVDYIPASVAVNDGDILVLSTKIGVALNNIAVGVAGAVQVEEVFGLPKKSSDTFAQGDACYWDATDGYITSTSTDNVYAGYAHDAAGSTTTVVNVNLNR